MVMGVRRICRLGKKSILSATSVEDSVRPFTPLFRCLFPSAPRTDRQRQRSSCLPFVCRQKHRREGRPWPRQAGALTSQGSATRSNLPVSTDEKVW